MELKDFQALTFDVYGTLIDWETGIFEALRPLTDRLAETPTREAVLQAHARHESAQQVATPGRRYADLLATVYSRLSEEWRTPASWDECVAYGQSIGRWPAFPDAADALRRLKSRYRLFVLSNVDNASFAASNEKLGVDFDGVYTAEDVGAYKPADANFEYMLNRLESDFGLDGSDILHTAQSLFHDHAPANRFGLANAWIDRQRLSEGGDWGATARVGTRPTVAFTFFSMREMADAVEEG